MRRSPGLAGLPPQELGHSQEPAACRQATVGRGCTPGLCPPPHPRPGLAPLWAWVDHMWAPTEGIQVKTDKGTGVISVRRHTGVPGVALSPLQDHGYLPRDTQRLWRGRSGLSGWQGEGGDSFSWVLLRTAGTRGCGHPHIACDMGHRKRPHVFTNAVGWGRSTWPGASGEAPASFPAAATPTHLCRAPLWGPPASHSLAAAPWLHKLGQSLSRPLIATWAAASCSTSRPLTGSPMIPGAPALRLRSPDARFRKAVGTGVGSCGSRGSCRPLPVQALTPAWVGGSVLESTFPHITYRGADGHQGPGGSPGGQLP